MSGTTTAAAGAAPSGGRGRCQPLGRPGRPLRQPAARRARRDRAARRGARPHRGPAARRAGPALDRRRLSAGLRLAADPLRHARRPDRPPAGPAASATPSSASPPRWPPSPGTPRSLIAARALLGVGGAMIMPATLSILRQVFPDRRERAMAIGMWSAVAAVGAAIGPVLGGFLVEHFWWGSVFLINIPLMAVMLPARPAAAARVARRLRRPWDVLGALTAAVGRARRRPRREAARRRRGLRAASTVAAAAAWARSCWCSSYAASAAASIR